MSHQNAKVERRAWPPHSAGRYGRVVRFDDNKINRSVMPWVAANRKLAQTIWNSRDASDRDAHSIGRPAAREIRRPAADAPLSSPCPTGPVAGRGSHGR